MSLLSLLRESKVEKTIVDLKNFSETISGSGNIINYEDTYDIPITAHDKHNGWQSVGNPERLIKNYVFDTMKETLYFFNELYKYQFKINHHCKITVDNLSVEVETYTHGFEGVTELDFKIKKYADDMFNEVNYFKRKG